jgi:hypothetical protein
LVAAQNLQKTGELISLLDKLAARALAELYRSRPRAWAARRSSITHHMSVKPSPSVSSGVDETVENPKADSDKSLSLRVQPNGQVPFGGKWNRVLAPSHGSVRFLNAARRSSEGTNVRALAQRGNSGFLSARLSASHCFHSALLQGHCAISMHHVGGSGGRKTALRCMSVRQRGIAAWPTLGDWVSGKTGHRLV